jgi:hypothetical protein
MFEKPELSPAPAGLFLRKGFLEGQMKNPAGLARRVQSSKLSRDSIRYGQTTIGRPRQPTMLPATS